MNYRIPNYDVPFHLTNDTIAILRKVDSYIDALPFKPHIYISNRCFDTLLLQIPESLRDRYENMIEIACQKPGNNNTYYIMPSNH